MGKKRKKKGGTVKKAKMAFYAGILLYIYTLVQAKKRLEELESDESVL